MGDDTVSLSQIRNRTEALERKLALPLAIVRLRPLAEAICDDWVVALAAHKPVPEPHSIVRRVASRGFRHLDFMALHKYVQCCRDENTLPDPHGIIRNLLPRAAPSGILDAALRWDAPARQ